MANIPTIYLPSHKAQRIKCLIPYCAVDKRKEIKKLNTGFYHPTQKLWSVVNTNDNLEKVKNILGPQTALEQPTPQKPTIPKRNLSAKAVKSLQKLEQSIILKGYSRNTLKTYRNELIHFFTYFDAPTLRPFAKRK